MIGRIGDSHSISSSSDDSGGRRTRRARCAAAAAARPERYEKAHEPGQNENGESSIKHAVESIDNSKHGYDTRYQRGRSEAQAAAPDSPCVGGMQQEHHRQEAPAEEMCSGSSGNGRQRWKRRRAPSDGSDRSGDNRIRKRIDTHSNANWDESIGSRGCTGSNGYGDSGGVSGDTTASGSDVRGSGGNGSDNDRSSQRNADHIGVRSSSTVPAPVPIGPVPVPVGSMPLSTVENCNEIQLRTRAILTYMRLISRPKSIRQRVREGLIRWVKVRAEEVKQQRRVDDLRELRGGAPSASTRHSSTTFKPAPKILKYKEVIRENKGQTQTRTKIGKRVAVVNERMGAISKRIAQREKRGDG